MFHRLYHNIYESKPVRYIIVKVYNKAWFHWIGIYLIQNNIVTNLQKVQQVTLQFTE